MKKTRKKISKKGWGVKWKGGNVDFFHNKLLAVNEMELYAYIDSTLFRCKIEEVTK